ncbi:MAG: Maf family protein [Solirubrobacteraceae bacterium]|nr:Maf family protein [Solirubrobacteraceae bacterium]
MSATPERATLVLASRSPQRRAILETLGVPFRVVASGADEATVGDPVAVAVANARRKALDVAGGEPAGTLVVGSDTVIVDDLDPARPARPVGKPRDADEAAAMLRRWSGSGHHVASAVAVVRSGGPGSGAAAGAAHEELLADADATLVRFRALAEDEVAWYVATGEWRERAGGYAIQLRGSLLVDGIDGDWWTVVGLPVALLARRLPWLLRG